MRGPGASHLAALHAPGGVLVALAVVPVLAIGAGFGAGCAAGCAAGPRPQGTYWHGDVYSEKETEAGPEPRTIEEWEARQSRHASALAQLAGVAPRGSDGAPDVPASEPRTPLPVRRPDGGGQAPTRPADAAWRHSRPEEAPVAPAPVQPGPPPASADRTLSQGRTRGVSGYKKVGPSLRCRQVCRHVRAICEAAGRICRIAGSLGDAPAREACRRGESRCAEARGLAQRICPSCPAQDEGRRSWPWRRWRAGRDWPCPASARPLASCLS